MKICFSSLLNYCDRVMQNKKINEKYMKEIKSIKRNIMNDRKINNGGGYINLNYYNNRFRKIRSIENKINERSMSIEEEAKRNIKLYGGSEFHHLNREVECINLNLGSYCKALNKARKRANGKSELSGNSLKNGYAVHHINSYNWDLDGRCDVDNLIVLSKEEHKLFHKKFGYGNNNKNQWEEFVNNKIYEKSAMELWWESKKVIPKEDREKLSGYYGGIK